MKYLLAPNTSNQKCKLVETMFYLNQSARNFNIGNSPCETSESTKFNFINVFQKCQNTVKIKLGTRYNPLVLVLFGT